MKLIFLLISLVSILGCDTYEKDQITLYEYSKNDLISTPKGILLDSTAPIVPVVLKNSDSSFFTGIDTNQARRNTQHYRRLWRYHNSILYNYFTGVEKIEMYYSGAWIDPILISFCKEGNQYWIQSHSIEQTKSQIRNPQLKVNVSKPISSEEELIQYQSISIEKNLWDSLKSVLLVNGFNSGKRIISKMMLDGSEILVQVHLKNGYNFLARNFYSDSTERIKNFFLNQAGFKTLMSVEQYSCN